MYAPADDDVLAFEPMTAPTNALVTGGPDLQLLAPGDTYRATFSLTVTDVGHCLAQYAPPVPSMAVRELQEPDAGEQVVSEVVTNAIRHGPVRGSIELLAVKRDDHLRVEVTDAGPGLAPRPRATESELGGGFGLFLVEQLARRWGLVRQRNTTRVWFEFELG